MLGIMHWVRLASPAYWIAFIGAFLAVAVWESASPLRPLSAAAGRRWRNHAVLSAASMIATGLVLRAGPVLVALAVQNSRWGVLNRAFIPFWINFAATLPALDFVLYASHRLFHSVHFLWRVHEVHHSDADFDVSTAVRFHPIEGLVTQALYLGAVALLAPPPAAVFTSQILIVAENLFVHANKSLPPAVERVLRWIVITPDVHRIHHSEEFADQNLNFGQLFPWWDRLFGTFVSVPARGREHFSIGLKELRGTDTMAIGYMLAAPFMPGPPVAPLVAPLVTTASTSPTPAPTPRSARS
jgi:sterol desaturase/sphingolipid hydroxylase (fatty acid hydroxylase superfamily)